MSELEFRVEIDSVTGMFKVYGRLYDIDPPVTRVVEPLKFRADHEGCLMEPCMELSHGDASSLMDQLYACGIRPTEDDKDVNEVVYDEVGFLKEILRRQDIHLGDIRNIVELRNEPILKIPKAKFDQREIKCT